MEQTGKHIVVDAFECDPSIINDLDKLKKLMIKAIDSLGMKVISSQFHRFDPQGVTGVIVLTTSHFSIHTWPENGYVSLDLYTCGESELWPEVKEVVTKLGAKRVSIYELSRGYKEVSVPKMKQITFYENTQNHQPRKSTQLRNGKGNEWDHIQLKEIINGDHSYFYRSESQYQDILLMEVKDLRLYLDQELQFSSIDERCYHEALVHPAMELAETHNRVLILGGGDGLALREILKYEKVKSVDLVDIDPEIINAASSCSPLISLNNEAFQDGRVTVHIEDAKKFLQSNKQVYDVIIIDFPDPVNQLLAELYTKEIFIQVAERLKSGGMIVCQSNSPEDAPQVYWSIGKTIEAARLFSVPYNTLVPSFGLWGFHLAAHHKINTDSLEVSVEHRTLPKKLHSMFDFPSSVLSKRKLAKENTLVDPTLHENYQNDQKTWNID